MKEEGPSQVKFDELTNFNTDSKQIISKDNAMKNLFVTEDENEVMKQFEREKDETIEKELGT